MVRDQGSVAVVAVLLARESTASEPLVASLGNVEPQVYLLLQANQEQLARWYRFLPSGDTKEQQKIMDRIAERFKRLGGMTPALEKKIGF